jgi:hypothetical protein
VLQECREAAHVEKNAIDKSREAATLVDQEPAEPNTPTATKA